MIPSAARICSQPRSVRQMRLARRSLGSRPAVEIALALEVLDEIAHRLLGDLCALGELGEPRTVGVDVLEDRGVCRADALEAGSGKSLTHALDDLLEWAAKQDAEVRSVILRGAGEGRICPSA